jgi:hypothetical protein
MIGQDLLWVSLLSNESQRKGFTYVQAGFGLGMS